MDEMTPLRKVQLMELDIFKEIVKICDDNQLTYYISGGTYLGAVRHKGFIPWDDDIDIWMPREDYDKFIELWHKNPLNGYILQNADFEDSFTQNFTKIRKDNTAYVELGEEKDGSFHKGIFIDIFPLDRVSNNKLNLIIQTYSAIFMQLFTRKKVPNTNNKVVLFISKTLLKIVPKKHYSKMRKHFEKKIISKSSLDGGFKFFGSMMSLSKEPYSKNMFDKFEFMSFENEKFMVTSIWDEVLTKFYGNYMELPPEEERVWAHHPVYIDFNNNYEV